MREGGNKNEMNQMIAMITQDSQFEPWRSEVTHSTGDEIHLLLHCNAMNNEREILLNSIAGIINMQPTNDIFLRIMTSRDITVVKSLAKFIYGCFKQIKG